MRKARLPRSYATNAYDLCVDIITTISEEPKRYHQGTWGMVLPPGPDTPACGTQACLAGWAVKLKRRRVRAPSDTRSVARDLLGLSNVEAERLFAVGSSQSPYGTSAHAIVGITALTAFMAKHRNRLKRKRIPR